MAYVTDTEYEISHWEETYPGLDSLVLRGVPSESVCPPRIRVNFECSPESVERLKREILKRKGDDSMGYDMDYELVSWCGFESTMKGKEALKVLGDYLMDLVADKSVNKDELSEIRAIMENKDWMWRLCLTILIERVKDGATLETFGYERED